ncbi:hypothetical protein pdam_00019255 [Pocillopora damicornis]|uniref:Reverse transcriptase domain-containing protein n=1 Tax=Pocillopora damicornis TaxID=46731 RepID=A0A3M6URN9_POCDA|nr:hypothetical protein pdam_00019255 [Pocillopora damicornis]
MVFIVGQENEAKHPFIENGIVNVKKSVGESSRYTEGCAIQITVVNKGDNLMPNFSNSNPLHIQHGLQGSLNKVNHWFSLNKMVPNAKKTKQLLLGTKQKLSYCADPSLNLSLNLLYNALIKPIFEYCCSVWGNTKIILIVQKHCARIILNAGTERSVGLFKRLGWIPITDIIEQRKLCIIHNIIQGKCPDYFNHYICYVKNRHRYTTWASTNMDLSTPFFSTMTSKCSFLASGTRLWNNLDSATRDHTSLCKFKNQLYKIYLDRNSRWTIMRTTGFTAQQNKTAVAWRVAIAKHTYPNKKYASHQLTAMPDPQTSVTCCRRHASTQDFITKSCGWRMNSASQRPNKYPQLCIHNVLT